MLRQTEQREGKREKSGGKDRRMVEERRVENERKWVQQKEKGSLGKMEEKGRTVILWGMRRGAQEEWL